MATRQLRFEKHPELDRVSGASTGKNVRDASREEDLEGYSELTLVSCAQLMAIDLGAKLATDDGIDVGKESKWYKRHMQHEYLKYEGLDKQPSTARKRVKIAFPDVDRVYTPLARTTLIFLMDQVFDDLRVSEQPSVDITAEEWTERMIDPLHGGPFIEQWARLSGRRFEDAALIFGIGAASLVDNPTFQHPVPMRYQDTGLSIEARDI